MKCDVPGIWMENRAKLFNFIHKRVRNFDDAHDILYTVLIKVYRYCERKSEVENIRSWLFQIAQNSISDHYNKLKRFSTLDIEQVEGLTPILQQDATIWVEPLLNLLPAAYSVPLKLSDLDSRPQREIAESLGLSLEATKSRIQRARKMLRRKFEECGTLELTEDQHFYFKATKPCCLELENAI